MSVIIITRPKAVIKSTVTTLADDPATDPTDGELAKDLIAQDSLTHVQKKWLVKFIHDHGFEVAPA